MKPYRDIFADKPMVKGMD